MNAIIKDIKSIMTLGVPLVLAQLCTMAMAITDAVIVGHGVGTQALAAMAFGLNFMNIVCIGLFGLSGATSVLVARAFGSGRTDEMPVILRHGILISFVIASVLMTMMCVLFDNLDWLDYLGQPPELIPIASPYLHFYAAAIVFQHCTSHCRSCCEAQNRPWLPLYVILGSIAANAMLAYALVFGSFGLPKLGLVGAGIATLVCSIGQFFTLVFVILRNNLHLALRELVCPSFFSEYFRRILGIGIPTVLQITVEIGSMTIVALFAGMIGTTTLAAHHVTMQTIAFMFMIPMGMSFAVSIRVSQAAGANDRAQVRRIGNAGIVFAFCWMTLSSAALISLHNYIPMLFTRDAEVISLASGFILIAGFFQIFDGIQCTAVGALRGLKDITTPMFMVIMFYWVIEIPISWVLCFKFHMGGKGIWLAMLFSLMLSASFLSMRLRRMMETKPLGD